MEDLNTRERLSFSFVELQHSPPEKFASIWGHEQDGRGAINLEAARIHFLSDVFVAVAVGSKGGGPGEALRPAGPKRYSHFVYQPSPPPLTKPRRQGTLYLKLYSEISLSRTGLVCGKKDSSSLKRGCSCFIAAYAEWFWYVLVFVSDKKKVETATSAEVSEKVNHSTSGTLVRDLFFVHKNVK